MAGKIGITFKDSKEVPVHRWYPYVEGFSSSWINDMLTTYCKEGMHIYDPFGGSGTMNIEASKMGLKSFYSEMNPFMRFILNTKVNIVRSIQSNKSIYLSEMNNIRNYILSDDFNNTICSELTDTKYTFLLSKDYFKETDLKYLKSILDIANNHHYSDEVSELVKCAVACITVDTSNMTRRADLRRRRSNEYLTRVVDVPKQFIDKWDQFIYDIENSDVLLEPAVCISNDARQNNPEYIDSFDFVITSPPYINGTNYIRNTTLELILTELVANDSELKSLKEKTVCGGISDACSSRLDELIKFPYVEDVAIKLDASSKDKRIPLMVRCYFSDMYKVLSSVYSMMKPNSLFALDIGDSKFYGVYVPTDVILSKLAEEVGFSIYSHSKIAERFSRDKTLLKQELIIFEKRTA